MDKPEHESIQLTEEQWTEVANGMLTEEYDMYLTAIDRDYLIVEMLIRLIELYTDGKARPDDATINSCRKKRSVV
jgi:hypothetical protein